MVQMMNKKWFRILVTLILVFLLIFLVALVDFVFAPLWAYLGAVAVPIIVAGLLYYITNPLVNLMERIRIPRILGILIVFLLIIGFFYLASIYIAPIIQEQFTDLLDQVPQLVESAQNFITYWQENRSILPQQLNDSINEFANNLGDYTDQLTSGIIGFLSGLFSIVFGVVLAPFFLFFMLKDSHKLVPYLTQFMSEKKSRSFHRLVENVNFTLGSFIRGQLIVSLFVGTGLFIGYSIIGLDYSLTMALLALVLNVIPFIGPFLAAIPAVLIGLLQDPIMALLVVLVTVIVQQIESTLISPNVMGKVLKLHPLTVITVILAASGIAGFVGLLFAIPFYATVKTIVYHFYKEWQKHQPVGHKELL